MMTRPLLSLGVMLGCATLAVAQPVPPGGGVARPSAGSYLSLFSGSGNPGINYLGITRPQQQLQQNLLQNQQQFQQAAGLFQQELNGLAVGADPNLPFTGRVARFNSLAPYYTRHPVTGSSGRIQSGFGGGGGVGGGFNSFAGSLSGSGGAGRTQGFGGAGGFGASAGGRAAAPRAGGARR